VGVTAFDVPLGNGGGFAELGATADRLALGVAVADAVGDGDAWGDESPAARTFFRRR
jgi:hypothetical protein